MGQLEVKEKKETIGTVQQNQTLIAAERSILHNSNDSDSGEIYEGLKKLGTHRNALKF